MTLKQLNLKQLKIAEFVTSPSTIEKTGRLGQSIYNQHDSHIQHMR